MKIKRICAFTAAVLTALAAASCGNSGKSEESSYVDKVTVEEKEDIEAIPDDAEKELDWLSYFDLNPVKGSKEKSTELTLFEQKGGSIHYSPCTSMTNFDALTTRLLANDPPDMFWMEGGMCFPNYCMKGMFQPVDSIVDFNSDMWSDVKGTADQYMLNGKHYVAPVKYVANSILTYDKDVMEANGFDDPYELYLDGNWDWNVWYDMMQEYVSNAPADEERYGVNGWIEPFTFYSTGHTLIEFDSEKNEYVSNIDDPNFERATTLLYNIQKNGLHQSEWIGQASDCFKQNILFYAMGPWASTDIHTPKDGNNWGNVPLPKDPNADKQYTSVEVNAYLWIEGSKKAEAMKTWYECCKTAYFDPEYLEVTKEKFFVKNPNWTEDMYHVAYEELSGDNWVQLVDPGFGLTNELSNDKGASNDMKQAIITYMYTSVMKTDDDGKQYTWTQLRETYKSTIDSELKAFNQEFHEFTGK